MIEVDVIIPFHNDVNPLLMKAINSVKGSRGVKAEPLLVNNNSQSDESTVYLKKLGYRVVNQSIKGYAEALNLGYQMANSEYVAILNSDDLQTPDRLLKQIQCMKKEETQVSICRLKKFGNYRKHFELSGKQPKNVFNKKFLLLGAYGANASLIISNEFSKRIKFENREMADWKFAIDYYPEKISFVDQAAYLYRMHKNQVSRGKSDVPYWFHGAWEKMFQSISSIVVQEKVVLAIAMPNKFVKLNERETENLVETLVELSNYFRHQELIDYPSVLNLLKRRWIFSTCISNNKALFLSNNLPFSKKSVIMEGLSMTFEGLMNFDIARR
jgi:glycosyltransferase involved in cell wall biosynthesis